MISTCQNPHTQEAALDQKAPKSGAHFCTLVLSAVRKVRNPVVDVKAEEVEPQSAEVEAVVLALLVYAGVRGKNVRNLLRSSMDPPITKW